MTIPESLRALSPPAWRAIGLLVECAPRRQILKEPIMEIATLIISVLAIGISIFTLIAHAAEGLY